MNSLMSVRGGWLLLIPALLMVGFLPGCTKSGTVKPDEGKMIPEGRILNNGLPLRPEGGGDLPPGDAGYQIIFIALDGAEAGKQMQASIIDEEEGSFELVGPEGKGIPPGKYRVAVTLGPEGGEDSFEGKYSPENSKIEIEVREGEPLVIDVAKYK